MNLAPILRYVLLTAVILLAAWAAAWVWPDHTHFLRHFFREMLRALL